MIEIPDLDEESYLSTPINTNYNFNNYTTPLLNIDPNYLEMKELENRAKSSKDLDVIRSRNNGSIPSDDFGGDSTAGALHNDVYGGIELSLNPDGNHFKLSLNPGGNHFKLSLRDFTGNYHTMNKSGHRREMSKIVNSSSLGASSDMETFDTKIVHNQPVQFASGETESNLSGGDKINIEGRGINVNADQESKGIYKLNTGINDHIHSEKDGAYFNSADPQFDASTFTKNDIDDFNPNSKPFSFGQNSLFNSGPKRKNPNLSLNLDDHHNVNTNDINLDDGFPFESGNINNARTTSKPFTVPSLAGLAIDGISLNSNQPKNSETIRDFNSNSKALSPEQFPTRKDSIDGVALAHNRLSMVADVYDLKQYDSDINRPSVATDLKTPAEYTLHIIFTQFVRHAESKLNLCLNYPLDQEPPINSILNKGSDVQFDKIISSLGFIAKRKPKPVIDSVMFWRKSKSELAAVAALELDKVVTLSKQNATQKVSPKVQREVRPKRSMSLIRAKSFSKPSHKRNQSTNSMSSPSSSKNQAPDKYSLEMENKIFEAKKLAVNADRKSLASIFILCRVLIEIVRQTSPEIMGEDLNAKLEEIVYTQLKTTEPITVSQSLVRSANWNLFAQLLGFMSENRFLSVSDRFIAELEKIPQQIASDQELRLQLLIYGMQYLRLTTYPPENFEDTAEFILSLSKFYDKCQSEPLLYAYSKVLNDLILPLTSGLTAESNHPIWVEATQKVYHKTYHILKLILHKSSDLPTTVAYPLKGKFLSWNGATSNGWAQFIYLITATLSVSNKEFFSDTWFKIILENCFKLKPKALAEDKYVFVVCTARLLWTFLYRLPDTLNNTIKKLDGVYALIFNSAIISKKNQWFTPDVNLANAVVHLIRVLGYQHLNHVLENMLLKLLKYSFNGSTLEGLSLERVMVLLHGYMAILEDYEIGNKPPFPTDEVLESKLEDQQFLNSYNASSFSVKNTFARVQLKVNPTETKKYSRQQEFVFKAKNSKNDILHEEICRNFASLLKLLDSQYGMHLWLFESQTNSSTAPLPTGPGPLSSSGKSTSSFSSFHFGLDFAFNGAKNSNMELFATLIDSIPWTIIPFADSNVVGILFKNVVEILTRNAVHPNSKVSNASIKALKSIASKKNPSNLITVFAKIAFQFTEAPLANYDPNFVNSREYKRLLKVYVELLNCWLTRFNSSSESGSNLSGSRIIQDDEAMNRDVLNDLYQINYKLDDSVVPDKKKTNPSDELEWKVMITVIEEVEGNGLFFLCSQDSEIRTFGISILKLVELFDQAIYTITDRAADIGSDANSLLTGSKTHSRSSSKFAADIGARLIHILEDVDFFDLIKPYRNNLSVPEKSRLSKLKNRKQILIKLAESDYGIDATIWFRLYPRLLDMFFERCPMPVAMCRSMICFRLVQMHDLVLEYSNNFKSFTSSLFSKANSAPPEVMINQWKLYLIFACCSLTSTTDQKFSFPTQTTHNRKRSMPMIIQHQKITSAKSIFTMVLPLLKSQQPMIRNAVVSGLSSMNINIFRTFLENLPACIHEWDYNSKHFDPSEVRLRVEVVNIISNITSRFKKHALINTDEWMLANLIAIIKNVKTFLSMPAIQVSFEFQTLRRYFCSFLENIFVGLLDSSILEKWLPFEARLACFNYLKEWCGHGDLEDVELDRYTAIYKIVARNKEAASIAAKLEVERKALRSTALSCMATICSGPIIQKLSVEGNSIIISFDIPGVMSWIRSLLFVDDEKCHEIGKLALRNILELNFDHNEDILDEVIKNCYMSLDSARATESYFTIFVDVFSNLKLSETPPYDIICLSSFLVGNDLYEVRSSAMKALKHFEKVYFQTSATVDVFTESVCSKTKIVYKKALFDISNHFATLFPDSAFTRVSYLTKFFNAVQESARRDILSCLLPWLRTIKLSYSIELVGGSDLTDVDVVTYKLGSKAILENQNQLTASSLMVLNNLFEITVKFSSTIYNEVEALWVALGNNDGNFSIIFSFLVANCLERKNQAFVEYSRQVIDYLAFSQPEPLYVVDKLIQNFQPKSMVPPQPQATTPMVTSAANFPYVADLNIVMAQSEKDASFSAGQLSIIFLVDLFTVRNERMIENLPTFLHMTVSLLDHYIPIVQELACALLIHLIHTLAISEPKATETIDILRQRDHHRYLWVYDDLNNDKKGAMTPRNMDLLVRNLLGIFSATVPTLQEDWSRVSLNWATTCAVRHLACRSFQVFRSLLSFLDQFMLKDMLHRLSNTIADDTQDIQGFAIQILMTLNAITAELDSDKLIDFPQLFWSSVACLSTIHEQEFIEVLSTMSKFVSKIDLDAPDTISCLISTFPPKWEGRFEGLQQVILVGLRSSTSWDPTIKFLDKLLQFKDSGVIGTGDSRLLLALIANLPRFLNAIENKAFTKEIEEAANHLGILANESSKTSLSRILYSFAKNRFRSKNDFLSQTIQTIKNLFFPEYEAQVLVSLLGMLSNKIVWVKLESMNILKQVLPLVDLQREEFDGVGADLISPLLRLLLTDYAEQALDVLDEAVSISGSRLDKDILRMSLGNIAMKKEYEKTATLFGIPEENGWAIPMPVVTAASTRNNVHAVFLTCSVDTIVTGEDEEEELSNGEIQFHMEDYYGPVVDHADTVSITIEKKDASLSNVWAALDDFDSFFTKDSSLAEPIDSSILPARREPGVVHAHSNSTDTGYSEEDHAGDLESVPYVYEKDASFILNKSLARTQSNISFKNSFADSMAPPSVTNQSPSLSTRRSYISFRGIKSSKLKIDGSLKSPVLSPQGDGQTIIKANATSTPKFTQNTLTNIVSPESPISSGSDQPTRFESLLGARGKKTKKPATSNNANQSNVNTPNMNESPLLYWSGATSNSPNFNSNGNATPTLQTPKVREKRKVSQKHK